MAKKKNTNTVNTVDNVETNVLTNSEPTPEVTLENVMEEAISNIPDNVQELAQKLEDIKPDENLINEALIKPDVIEPILHEKIEELNKLEDTVKKEMEKVIAVTPSLKNKNNFTYVWNGVNLYE